MIKALRAILPVDRESSWDTAVIRLATISGRMITCSMFISNSPGKPISITVVARFSGETISWTGLFTKAPIRNPTAAPRASKTMSKFRRRNPEHDRQHLLLPTATRNLFAMSLESLLLSDAEENTRKKCDHRRLFHFLVYSAATTFIPTTGAGFDDGVRDWKELGRKYRFVNCQVTLYNDGFQGGVRAFGAKCKTHLFV